MKIHRQVFGFNPRLGPDSAGAVAVVVVVDVAVVVIVDVIRAPRGDTRNREIRIPREREKSPDIERRRNT